MRYSLIAAALISAAQALPTTLEIENSPAKSLQGTAFSHTLGDVDHVPYGTIHNRKRSWDDENDRQWNTVNNIIGKIPKESQSEFLGRYWQVGVKDEKGVIHPAWKERASGKLIQDADLEKEIQRAFDEYTRSKAEPAMSAGGSSLNNEKDTHRTDEKGDNVVFRDPLPWQRKPGRPGITGNSQVEKNKDSTVSQTNSKASYPSSEEESGLHRLTKGTQDNYRNLRGQSSERPSQVQTSSDMNEDNGQAREGVPYDKAAYNQIMNQPNPAYESLRQDFNGGEYKPGVDGFDSSGNPIIGDQGNYDAALWG